MKPNILFQTHRQSFCRLFRYFGFVCLKYRSKGDKSSQAPMATTVSLLMPEHFNSSVAQVTSKQLQLLPLYACALRQVARHERSGKVVSTGKAASAGIGEDV